MIINLFLILTLKKEERKINFIMTSNKTTFTKKEIKINQSQAKELFLKRPVWQSLLIVSVPGVAVAFFQGLFIFVSQIMLVDLIPIDGLHSNQWIWGPDYNNVVAQIKIFNETHPNNILPIYNIQDIIRSANSFTSSLRVVVNATVLLGSQGAAVLYSRALGTKHYSDAKNIYYESIITSIIFSLLISFIMLGVSRFWIESQASLPHNYDNLISPQIEQYYSTFSTVTINWATNYFYVFLVSTPFQAFFLICLYFLLSEGRNKSPSFLVIFSQLIGLLFCFLLIYYAKIEMYAAAIATILLYVVNICFFLIYIYFLEKKQLTCLSISLNNKLQWKWHEIWAIIYIGLINFCKNISIGFSMSFSLQVLNEVNESLNGSSHALFYSSVSGVVLPIYSLIYRGMIGIVRAGRSIGSYVYGVQNFKKFKEVYWYTNLYTFLFSGFLFIVVVFFLAGYQMPGSWGHNGPIILIFNLNYNDNPHLYSQVQYFLMIYLLQLPFFSFANAGSLFFQAAKKPLWGIVCALMQGVFVLIPVLFIMKQISLDTHSVEPSLWVPAINGIVTSFIVGMISVIYIYTKFKKEEQKIITQKKQDLFLKAKNVYQNALKFYLSN